MVHIKYQTPVKKKLQKVKENFVVGKGKKTLRNKKKSSLLCNTFATECVLHCTTPPYYLCCCY